MRERQARHLEALFAPAGEARADFFELNLKAVGAPPPKKKPPAEFTWREYVVYLLTIAAQIEHALMVQYLYAAWSLGGPQVPDEHRDDVAEWRQLILGIAKEEMGHLATVQNVLRFLGAPLELDREDYPWDTIFAPFPLTLEPLTRRSLARYVLAESPAVWPAGVTHQEREAIEKLATDGGSAPVNRVGALFDKILEILSSDAMIPTSSFHPESYETQSSWDEWGRGYGKGARGSSIAGTHSTPDVLVLRVASRTDAIAALKAVATQGEAPSVAAAADAEASHFSRFLRIFRGYPEDAGWSPSRHLPTNPVAPGLDAGDGQTQIVDPEAGLWAGLFNIRYRMLLSYLGHTYFAPRSGAGDRRGVIVNRMFGEMYNLRAISALLVEMPLGDGTDLMAAPTFQMPYTLALPQSDAGYWTLHLELLAATRNLLDEVKTGTGAAAQYAKTLASLDKTAAAEMTLYADAARVRVNRQQGIA